MTDEQDVVQLVYSVDLRQQLVDDGVVDTGAAGDGSSGTTDGVDLVEDDDVQSTVWTHLHAAAQFSKHIPTAR